MDEGTTVDRRQFIRLAGLAGAAVGTSGVLASCKSSSRSGGAGGGRTIKLG